MRDRIGAQRVDIDAHKNRPAAPPVKEGTRCSWAMSPLDHCPVVFR
ncbi:MAG: hypothetical protein IPG10_18570 [Flavobacteriales bacterium]|nr:hypothetical protein [Flavobacteriales bacterium]MBK6756012.1 hypothetical protein [Flavobacteriales bacterium]MBK7751995.1 hypothetical protein [Flavobacteriales bacterium]MBK9074150.1 hypothetical protein [Flavobacteriales bacterium]MBK9539755.1 hypothetical protein [Flavobacteriales bacterium]